MQASRILLVLAAIIATVSIGVATLRPEKAPDVVAAPGAADRIAALEARVKSRPDDVEGWALLGLGFYQTGRFAESATAYKRAATLSPDVAEHWANFGEALVMASNGKFPAEAKVAFDNALARDAKDARARYFLAVEKDISGNHKGAIDDWFALLRDAPPGAPWLADVRTVITEVATKAKIDVTDRLAALGQQPGTDQQRAIAALPASEQNAMIASMVDGLARKLEAEPRNPEGWIMLMRSYAALGRTGDAQAALRRAIAANPASAPQLNAAAAELKVK